MPLVPEAVERLIAEFGRLPGVGPKTAQRLTFFCLRAPAEVSQRLSGALGDLHEAVRPCSRCYFIAQGELCAICSDARRDATQICVVEEPLDVLAIERSGEFHGLYHVLGGALSPMDGIGPDELRIAELEQLALVQQTLNAHTYWRLKGLEVDLVILNDHPTSYHEELHEQLQNLAMASDAQTPTPTASSA